MAGAGAMPAGTGPVGSEEAQAALVQPRTERGDTGSRFINSESGDYEIDTATKQFKQMPGTRQRVLLALLETLGSSTVRPNDGVKLPDKIGTNFVPAVQHAVRTALRQLAEVEGVIRIEGILVSRRQGNTSRVEIIVSYTDLSTGETGINQEVTIG